MTRAAALAALAVVAGCGDCGGHTAGQDAARPDAARPDAAPPDAARPTNDAGKWCDGGCPPPSAQVAWDHAVLSTPQDQIDVCGAVVLPTGIAILAPPKYILLADKTDGHLIAQARWPTAGNNYPSSCGPAIARGSGNLAIVTDDYPTSSTQQFAVHEYAWSDLSAVKTTVLSTTAGPGLSVIGEFGGEIYVLSRGGTTVSTLSLYSLPDGGSVQTQVLATGNAAATSHGSFAVLPGGGLLTCASYSKYGPPAVLRIDPPKTMTKTLSFDGGTGAGDCRLIAGPDRNLVYWGLVHQPPHWDIVSAHGTKLLADTAGLDPGIFSVAYGEGAFALVTTPANARIYLYAIDPDTAAARGPYNVAVPYPDIGTPAIAGEGQNLWVAYDVYGGAIHLTKLGPLPPK